jgi:hypothetical protein
VGLEFDQLLKPDGPPLLTAIWKIHSTKATGVLTLEWEKFKKQVVFKSGEPTVVRSNMPDESLAAFLVKQKIVDAAALKNHIAKKDKESDKSSLSDSLVRDELISVAVLQGLMQQFFRDRVLQMFSITKGSLSFKSVAETTSFGSDVQTLGEPFRKVLWEAIQPLYSERTVLLKLATQFAKVPYVTGAFPFALNGKELRAWNAIESAEKNVKELPADSQKLLAIALDIEMVRWQETSLTTEAAAVTEATLPATIAEIARLEVETRQLLPHEILRVDLNASLEECQSAYYELVRRYHPDRLSGATPEQKAVSETLLMRINSAFGTMTDVEKRTEYLAQMELQKAGGIEAIQKRIDAEFMIPQAQQALKRRHYQAAFELYSKIRDVIKDDAEVLAEAAFVELQLAIEAKKDIGKRADYFRSYFDEAIRLRPQYAAAHYYLGILNKALGLVQAQQDFERALELDSKLVEAASELRLIGMRSKKR